MDDDTDQHHFCGKGVLRGVGQWHEDSVHEEMDRDAVQNPAKDSLLDQKNAGPGWLRTKSRSRLALEKNSAATAGPELPWKKRIGKTREPV
jgi:hypothetical protein